MNRVVEMCEEWEKEPETLVDEDEKSREVRRMINDTSQLDQI